MEDVLQVSNCHLWRLLLMCTDYFTRQSTSEKISELYGSLGFFTRVELSQGCWEFKGRRSVGSFIKTGSVEFVVWKQRMNKL